MFTSVTGRIEALLAEREQVVVAVSGFGGAGKTTLAARLLDQFGEDECTVVGLDSFIVNRGRGEGRLGGFDWERFTAVLRDARAGRRLRYQPNDFDGCPRGPLVVEPPRAVVIAEGVRLIRGELRELFDLTVWIRCPLEVAERRGTARDRAAGVGEEGLSLWHDVWSPKERAHFEADRPDLSADLLLPVDL